MIAFDADRREVAEPLLDERAQTVERTLGFPYAHMTALRVELTVGHGDRRSDVVVVGELVLAGLSPSISGDTVVLTVTRTPSGVDAELVDPRSGRRASLSVPVG